MVRPKRSVGNETRRTNSNSHTHIARGQMSHLYFWKRLERCAPFLFPSSPFKESWFAMRLYCIFHTYVCSLFVDDCLVWCLLRLARPSLYNMYYFRVIPWDFRQYADKCHHQMVKEREGSRKVKTSERSIANNDHVEPYVRAIHGFFTSPPPHTPFYSAELHNVASLV